METTTTSNVSVRLSIRIMEVLCIIDAIVLNDEYLTEDMIIGRDLLDQNHIMIKSWNTLTFRNLPDPTNAVVNYVDEFMNPIHPMPAQ